MTDDSRQEYYKFRLVSPDEKQLLMFQKLLDLGESMETVSQCVTEQGLHLARHDTDINKLREATFARDQAVKWHGRALTALWAFLGLSFMGMLYFVIAQVATAAH